MVDRFIDVVRKKRSEALGQLIIQANELLDDGVWEKVQEEILEAAADGQPGIDVVLNDYAAHPTLKRLSGVELQRRLRLEGFHTHFNVDRYEVRVDW